MEPSLKLGNGHWVEGYESDMNSAAGHGYSNSQLCGSTVYYAIQYANTLDMMATRVFDATCEGFDFDDEATDEVITMAPTPAATTMAPTPSPEPVAAITLNMPASMTLEMLNVPEAEALGMRVLVSGLERAIRAVFNAVDYKYDVNILTVDGEDITQYVAARAKRAQKELAAAAHQRPPSFVRAAWAGVAGERANNLLILRDGSATASFFSASGAGGSSGRAREQLTSLARAERQQPPSLVRADRAGVSGERANSLLLLRERSANNLLL
jgi:hypothetical protein